MTLPAGFESYFRRAWSAEAVDALIRGLDEDVPVSIRLNPSRMPSDAWPEGGESRVPWCPEGIYLSQRPLFTADPLLHAGAYYVQEASSMFVAHVLRHLIFQLSTFNFQLSTLLDLCAAPGGKSTLLRSLLPTDSWLVSNEPVRGRAQVLAENLTKWGAKNTIVTQTYARDLARLVAKDKAFAGFDLVLADVPCSGEGMMRKEEAAVRQWSPQFVNDCAALQRSIVHDIWPALRPGGFMIYSTCTFNPEEDEENVEWIARELGADIIPVPVDPAWGIRGDMRKATEAPSRPPQGGASMSSGLPAETHVPPRGDLEGAPFCHFIPGLVRGEGFFCALLRKHGETDETSKNTPQRRPPLYSPERGLALPLGILRKWSPPLGGDGRGLLGDDVAAPRVDLSLNDAVRYLQREALTLPTDTPRGIVQVCFRGQRLGLAKNIGSRANNLYPKEWRIRSGFLTPHTLFP